MADKHVDGPASGAPAATDPQEAPDGGVPPETAELQQERDDMYDRLLRKTAEFDNYRKRVERERREQADQGIADLLQDLLLVLDDFELAITADAARPQATKQTDSSYRKGVELIHAKLQDLLHRRGLRPVVALGADFDPNLHQAVSHEASPEHREGEVIGEMRRGYMMGDRLLRPAMVKVAKA